MKPTEKIVSLVAVIYGAVAALTSASIILVRELPGGQTAAGTLALQQQLTPYTVSLYGATFLLAAALFVIGIGLYREREWAHGASFIWSLSALGFIPVQLWLELGIIQPRTQAAVARLVTETNRELAAQLTSPMTDGQWAFVIARHLIIFAPLPVMLLLLHLRSKSARPASSTSTLSSI